MAILDPLFEGVTLLLVPTIALLALAGTLWGYVAGAMPGIGPPVAIGVMIPLTFVMEPTGAVAFLVAIGLGSGYGNSIPAVLVGVPGTPSAFLTAIDGYALHRRGETGLGLGAAYFGTVSSQWIGVVLFTIMVIPLSRLPYHFLFPELFALYFFGLAAVVSLTGKNVVKGLMAAAFGVAVSLVGADPIAGIPRLTFGVAELRSGIGIIPAALGVVALGELVRGLRQVYGWGALSSEFSAKFPSLRAYRRLLPGTLMGSVIGTFMGAIPGVGSTPAAAVAYQQSRFFSRDPEMFGKGSPDGIAANEAAGSASNVGELVPTLALGVPGSATAALLLGALTIHGLIPGPLLIVHTPELLHAAIAGAVGATIATWILGPFTAKLLMRIALTNRAIVLVVAIFLTVVGVYSVRRSLFEVAVLLVAGLVGYFMLRYGYSTAAAALGLILGSGLESNLRRGLVLENNSFLGFVTRPITAFFLAVSCAFLAWGVYSTWRIARRDRERTLAQERTAGTDD